MSTTRWVAGAALAAVLASCAPSEGPEVTAADGSKWTFPSGTTVIQATKAADDCRWRVQAATPAVAKYGWNGDERLMKTVKEFQAKKNIYLTISAGEYAKSASEIIGARSELQACLRAQGAEQSFK